MLLNEIGLQLYSLRDETAKDFRGTVAKVAEMGYSGVEFAGYGGLKPNEMAQLLKDNGLKAYSTHFGSIVKTEEEWDFEIEMALATGYKYLICPGHKVETRDDALGLAELLNKAADRLRPHGLSIGYHNHHREFVVKDGEILMETVLKNTMPEVVMQFDVYWVAYAGYDPLRYIRKYAGRQPLMHLKELGPDRKENVECGTGILDFEAIINAGKAVGTQHFIVEQEGYTLPPLESCKVSLDNLKQL